MERYRCAPISVIIIVTTADMNILDKQVEKELEGYMQKMCKSDLSLNLLH